MAMQSILLQTHEPDVSQHKCIGPTTNPKMAPQSEPHKSHSMTCSTGCLPEQMHCTGRPLLQVEQLAALATAVQEGWVPGLGRLTTSGAAHSQLQMRQHAVPSVSLELAAGLSHTSPTASLASSALATTSWPIAGFKAPLPEWSAPALCSKHELPETILLHECSSAGDMRQQKLQHTIVEDKFTQGPGTPMTGHCRGTAEKHIKGRTAYIRSQAGQGQRISHKGQLGHLKVSQQPPPQQAAAQQKCSITSSQ